MVVTGIINNISFLIVLSFLYSLMYQKQNAMAKIVHRILTGILFGLIALAGMLNPMQFAPGIIFDGRSIILSLGAYFGGPIVAVISAFATSLYRLYLGGAGALVGIAVICTSALVGLLYRYVIDSKFTRKILPLYGLGLVVHILMMLEMLLLPGNASSNVIHELTIPVLIIYPLATLIVAKMLIDREDYVNNQAQLVASEALFKAVFATANVGKSITQPSGEINVNQAFCDMLGYTAEEMHSRKWQEITPPDEVEGIEMLLAPLLKGEKDSARFEKRYIRKDGAFIWADVSVMMRRDHSGKPEHFITTVVPITEQKRAQEALERLKDDLETQVAEKTKELQDRVEDLERFYEATIEREIRMNALKEEMKRLKKDRDDHTSS